MLRHSMSSRESGMVQQSVAGEFKNAGNENRPRRCYVTAGVKRMSKIKYDDQSVGFY